MRLPAAAQIYWPEYFFSTLLSAVSSCRENKLETLHFEFRAGRQFIQRRVQVGVVASGNLEVLLEPEFSPVSKVRVRTSVDGYREEWTAILRTFFERHEVAAAIEINDGGASPPIVLLRLEQALEESQK
jgi:malonate decarboxylase delta subunit